MKNFLFTSIILTLLLIMCIPIVFAVSFSDLTNEHWAYEPIIEMANKGILSWYPDGTFLPNKSITRAEFAKILVLSLNLKDATNKNNVFDDVDSSHWSYDYVRIASNYLSGYTNGSQIYFMPDEQAVREDMAVAIVMATGLQNKQYSLSTLDRFSDKDSISESFKKYVAIAVENNLMHGNADGSFNPKGKLTRAEVSQLMLNTTKELDKIAIGDKESIEADTTKDIKLSCNKKDGSTLQENDTIKLIAEGSNIDGYSFWWSVDCNGRNVLANGFRNGDEIKVSELIEAPKRRTDENPDYYGELYGKEVVLTLCHNDIVENKKEFVTTYKFKIVENNINNIVLSLDKKEGSILNKKDVLRFTSKNCEGDFHCLVSIKEDGGWHGSYQKDLLKEDQIKVSDFINHYSKYENIDLYGKQIKITIYSKKYGEYTNIAKIEVEYSIEANEESDASDNGKPISNSWLIGNDRITYWLFKESRSTLKSNDVIKFEADNYKYSLPIMCEVSGGEGEILYHRELSTKDEINMKDVIKVYKDNGRDIHGKQIVITIYSQQFGEFSNNLRMTAIYQLEK